MTSFADTGVFLSQKQIIDKGFNGVNEGYCPRLAFLIAPTAKAAAVFGGAKASFFTKQAPKRTGIFIAH